LATDAAIRSHAWGLDPSGSEQGAGGVGGLVFTTEHAGSTTCHPTYDGNGNVMSLRASDGTTKAKYEYGPFGEMLTARDVLAGSNPWRFSTKYQDSDTGLYYYGYRYYNAGTGRWLSRDPIGENDGPNMYAFSSNLPIARHDVLGLWQRVNGMGTFSGSLGAGRKPAESDFALLFQPDVAAFKQSCYDCQEVRFLQIYFFYYQGNHLKHGLTVDKWTIDGSPFYPYGTFQDPRRTFSMMNDSPMLSLTGRVGQDAEWDYYGIDFEVCAVCTKGEQRGDVYGCLTWGHLFRSTGTDTEPAAIVDWTRYVNDTRWGNWFKGNAYTKDGQIVGWRSPTTTWNFSGIVPNDPTPEMQRHLSSSKVTNALR
jgi:RHS repeat-associated protein